MFDAFARVEMYSKYFLITQFLFASNATDWQVVVCHLLSAGEQSVAQRAPRRHVRGVAAGVGDPRGGGVLQVPVPGLGLRGVVRVRGEAAEVRGRGQVTDLRQDRVALQLGGRLGRRLHGDRLRDHHGGEGG